MDKGLDLNRRIKEKGRFLGGCHGFLLDRQSTPGVVFSGIPGNGAVRVKACICKPAQILGRVPSIALSVRCIFVSRSCI
jgi:hypothetical protein